ncbi:hypothetical protein JCM19297_314 [Nonlabens ulvanivorans]|nr:hypothetical protein [Nonlabens ulvanivorans]GAK89692.1 hypothetical protein JCM19297_314 [Nonlabens ulvanivorans]
MKKLNINFVSLFRNALQRISLCDTLCFRDVSMYYSLLQYWNKYRFPDVLSINRQELMNYAKIRSHNTYLKSLHNLQDAGFIKYYPSSNPSFGSKISFCVDMSIVCQKLTTSIHSDDIALSSLLNNSKLEQINQTPEKKEVLEYFISISSTEELAQRFFNHNESLGWKSKGQLIVNWKPFANNYVKNDKARKVAGSSRVKRQGSSQFDSGNFKTSGHE